MKLEVAIPDAMVQAIAAAVVDRLRPVILGLTAPPAKADDLMGVDELAAYLGTSKDWIYHRAAANEICFVKVGRLLKFRRADIDLWLSRQSVPDIASLSAVPPSAGRGIANPETRQNNEKKRPISRSVK